MTETTQKITRSTNGSGSFQKPLSRPRIRVGLFITLTGFFIYRRRQT